MNVYQNYRQIKELLENNSLLMIVLNTISKGKKLEGVVRVTGCRGIGAIKTIAELNLEKIV